MYLFLEVLYAMMSDAYWAIRADFAVMAEGRGRAGGFNLGCCCLALGWLGWLGFLMRGVDCD